MSKNNFQKMVENKHKIIDRFPTAIVFVSNSPVTNKLISELTVIDAIDAMARQAAGVDIKMEDFMEHLSILNDITKTISETNKKLIDKIVNNDELFMKDKNGNIKPKLKFGLIANKQVRLIIENKKKELLEKSETK